MTSRSVKARADTTAGGSSARRYRRRPEPRTGRSVVLSVREPLQGQRLRRPGTASPPSPFPPWRGLRRRRLGRRPAHPLHPLFPLPSSSLPFHPPPHPHPAHPPPSSEPPLWWAAVAAMMPRGGDDAARRRRRRQVQGPGGRRMNRINACKQLPPSPRRHHPPDPLPNPGPPPPPCPPSQSQTGAPSAARHGHPHSEISDRHGPASRTEDTICPTAQRCACVMRPDSECSTESPCRVADDVVD